MRIKELRIKHRFTQTDLAKKLNTSLEVILNWENEIYNPDFVQLSKLADLFNVSIDYLLEHNSVVK